MIDGDTIVINKMHIRLAGIDAPELDHPWGRQSKWALVNLCKGQVVTARLKPEMSYDRVVAECFLPDGRDLAAELVKAGLALDWPKFSGGKYRHLEPADARQKLWRAQLRQRGLTPPGSATGPSIAERGVGRPPERLPYAADTRVVDYAPRRRGKSRLGWLIASATLVMLAGCQLIGGGADRNAPAGARPGALALASFEVTAMALNVREEPTARSGVIGQIGRGTIVAPSRVSGSWYGVEMHDGSRGWVHSDFLRPIDE